MTSDERILDWLDKKLEKCRKSVKGYGDKRGLKETADDALKTVDAFIRIDAPKEYKTVAEIDAWVKRDPRHTLGVEMKRKRYSDFAAAELYKSILFAEVDKYRTDAATDRDINKRHR